MKEGMQGKHFEAHWQMFELLLSESMAMSLCKRKTFNQFVSVGQNQPQLPLQCWKDISSQLQCHNRTFQTVLQLSLCTTIVALEEPCISNVSANGVKVDT